ncbi:MAG: ATP-binding protein [Methanobrevibacter sp.]|nr:ATP-binding protein [Candidatus Methanoflexus mossambicus]
MKNQNPVDFDSARVDFSEIGHKTPEKLEIALNNFLDDMADKFSVFLKSGDLTYKFTQLIKNIHKTTGKQVVVLIDEYDKAITSHIDDIEIAKANRDMLRDFYQVLKGVDGQIKFLFITGISKFAKTSIFSDLNSPDDLTIHPRYSNICGYTQEDLEYYFKDHLVEVSNWTKLDHDALILAVKRWYDGYSWNGLDFIYNPFSVLKFLGTGEFTNYWGDTGTPKILVDLIKSQNIDIELLLNKKSEFAGAFPNFELDNIDFYTVLLQSGYLTMTDKKVVPGDESIYTTEIPNLEVEKSLFSYIMGVYTNNSSQVSRTIAKQMITAILSLDTDELQKLFETLLHKIPNIIWGKVKESESLYQILFISWIHLLGFDIEGEIQTLKGRLDAVLKQNNTVVIIEFKFSENKTFEQMFEKAKKQIIKNEYYKSYQDKKIIILRVAFQFRDLKCKLQTLNDFLNE